MFVAVGQSGGRCTAAISDADSSRAVFVAVGQGGGRGGSHLSFIYFIKRGSVFLFSLFYVETLMHF